ncbi:hypothetical protein [Mycobacterium sp. E802]|uniref:hypothetical protein n=1 Tax=Mycobacterium sp. E802 TaxID=1834152 RepID=UPI001E4CCE39|nr:hypothetical protein [Mycobacterium sp. E802]
MARIRWWIGLACCAVLLAGCADATVIGGRATSMLFLPDRVGGLPVTDGHSGTRPDAPAPRRQAENTDGGQIDDLALIAIDDIEDFWSQNYRGGSLPGEFTPVSQVVSFNSDVSPGLELCGESTVGLTNAFYCFKSDVLAWDRGVAIPVAAQYFGQMGVVAVMAHEYGHAVQQQARLVARHVAYGKSEVAAGRWVAEVDEANARLVAPTAVRADLVVTPTSR